MEEGGAPKVEDPAEDSLQKGIEKAAADDAEDTTETGGESPSKTGGTSVPPEALGACRLSQICTEV